MRLIPSRPPTGPVAAAAVRTAGDARAFVALLGEQRRWLEDRLGVGVADFQPSAQHEYDDPPTAYAATGTVAILGRVGRQPQGIVAVKPLGLRRGHRAIELKRLYVRPEARGTGLGRELTWAALDVARSKGAGLVVLETHEGHMPRAVALYRALGFVDAEPLGTVAHPGVLTLELRLDSDRAGKAPGAAVLGAAR